MPKKSTYAITLMDVHAAKTLGLDSHVRQVNFCGTFPSKAAFARAVLLARPFEPRTTLARETMDWGLRPEYVEENTLYVEPMLGAGRGKAILLRDITGTR